MKKQKRFAAVVAALVGVCLLVCVLAACNPPPAATISLDRDTLIMYIGDTSKLTAEVTGSNETASWSTSDDKVVTVRNGVLTAVGEGNATVTAGLESGSSAVCAVEVRTRTITISQATATINIDVDNKLTLTAEASDGGTVTWSSSDSGIATVSGGVVTAHTMGEVTITAQKGAAKASCVITVIEPSRPADYYLLTMMNNADTRGNAGTWTYWADGSAPANFEFSDAPVHQNSGLSVVFVKAPNMTSQYFYFRYQPVFDAGTVYTLKFTAEMSQNGTIRFGSPGGTPTTFTNAQLTKDTSVNLTFAGAVTDAEPFSIRIGALESPNDPVTLKITNIVITEGDGEPDEPDEPGEKYNLALTNNAGSIADSGKWHYWADGEYELNGTPAFDDGIITLPLKNSTSTATYQLRYQTTEYEIGNIYSISFTATLDAPGSITYGRGGTGADVVTQMFAEADSKNFVWTGALSDVAPFSVQVKASDATKPITLTVKDVVISDPAPAGETYVLERKTNGEVVASPGRWYCQYDGSDGNEFKFSEAPVYDNGTLRMGFERHAAGTPAYQFRYQPEYATGTAYSVTFRVQLTAPGKVVYGTDNKLADFPEAGTENITWTGAVSGTAPFYIQVRGNNPDTPIAMTVTNIVFSLV